jgi:hypothetical protein
MSAFALIPEMTAEHAASIPAFAWTTLNDDVPVLGRRPTIAVMMSAKMTETS